MDNYAITGDMSVVPARLNGDSEAVLQQQETILKNVENIAFADELDLASESDAKVMIKDLKLAEELYKKQLETFSAGEGGLANIIQMHRKILSTLSSKRLDGERKVKVAAELRREAVIKDAKIYFNELIMNTSWGCEHVMSNCSDAQILTTIKNAILRKSDPGLMSNSARTALRALFDSIEANVTAYDSALEIAAYDTPEGLVAFTRALEENLKSGGGTINALKIAQNAAKVKDAEVKAHLLSKAEAAQKAEAVQKPEATQESKVMQKSELQFIIDVKLNVISEKSIEEIKAVMSAKLKSIGLEKAISSISVIRGSHVQ